jgi:hypothetical protein
MLSGSTEKVLTVVAQIFFRNSHNIPALPHLVARTMDGHETGIKKILRVFIVMEPQV